MKLFIKHVYVHNFEIQKIITLKKKLSQRKLTQFGEFLTKKGLSIEIDGFIALENFNSYEKRFIAE